MTQSIQERYNLIIEKLKDPKPKKIKETNTSLKKIFLKELDLIKESRKISDSNFIRNEIKAETEEIYELKYGKNRHNNQESEKKPSYKKKFLKGGEKIEQDIFFFYYDKLKKKNKIIPQIQIQSAPQEHTNCKLNSNRYSSLKRSTRGNSENSFSTNKSENRSKSKSKNKLMNKKINLPPIINNNNYSINFSNNMNNLKKNLNSHNSNDNNDKDNEIKESKINLNDNDIQKLKLNLRGINLGQEYQKCLDTDPNGLPVINCNFMDKIDEVKNLSNNINLNIYRRNNQENNHYHKEKIKINYLNEKYKGK